MMKRIALAGAALLTAGLASADAQTASKPGSKVDAAVVDAYVKGMWKKVPAGWESRIVQDETQKVCSEHRNNPPDAVFQQVLDREKATVVFPADGNVMGDWKAGEKIAQSGFGGRFNDKAGAVNGGNCYACHQMAKEELSFGTLGPSLREYGKIRKFSAEEAKLVYARVYDSQSVQPCSMMPRFGYHKFLSEQQMKDVVAYLMSPDSPVNK
ncbi:MAG TPA: sulfur oxidation c-type cytochrome SoxX [Hyphomicrobiaceae bacterium]|nr:sulfur oxidation c-type cytochrome SoxX [Hyphomicrobiaceae bacterium]